MSLGDRRSSIIIPGPEPWQPGILSASRSDLDWKTCGDLSAACDRILEGRYIPSERRALYWRLLLQVIDPCSPPSTWASQLIDGRAHYTQLKEEYVPNITVVAVEAAADPLSDGKAWQDFYEKREELETINADLTRLSPAGSGEYFDIPETQQIMRNVLLVWAGLHPSPGYRQGMHELLASLMWSLKSEQECLVLIPSEHPVGGTLLVGGTGAGSIVLETDSFLLFDALMEGLLPIYEVHSNTPSNTSSGRIKANGTDNPSGLQELCASMQGERLQAVDPKLHQHLQQLDICPQLYGIRWARLLFSREFDLETTLLVWDHLFAMAARDGAGSEEFNDFGEAPQRKLVRLRDAIETFAVAMVTYQRENLLASDSTGCFQILVRPPNIDSLRRLLSLVAILHITQTPPPSQPIGNEGFDASRRRGSSNSTASYAGIMSNSHTNMHTKSENVYENANNGFVNSGGMFELIGKRVADATKGFVQNVAKTWEELEKESAYNDVHDGNSVRSYNYDDYYPSTIQEEHVKRNTLARGRLLTAASTLRKIFDNKGTTDVCINVHSEDVKLALNAIIEVESVAYSLTTDEEHDDLGREHNTGNDRHIGTVPSASLSANGTFSGVGASSSSLDL